MSCAKTPEAAERERVYQEGQRAFGTDAVCLYDPTDWRVRTWNKGWKAASDFHDQLAAEEQARIARGPEDTAPDNFDGWWLLHCGDFASREDAARAAWEAKP